LAVFERVDGNRERTSAELAVKKVGEQLLRSTNLYHLLNFLSLCTIVLSSGGLLKTPGFEWSDERMSVMTVMKALADRASDVCPTVFFEACVWWV
jgi:hypothetical protein